LFFFNFFFLKGESRITGTYLNAFSQELWGKKHWNLWQRGVVFRDIKAEDSRDKLMMGLLAWGMSIAYSQSRRWPTPMSYGLSYVLGIKNTG